MGLNTFLIAFVYSILVREALNESQIKQVMDGDKVPSDFCDDSLLLSQAFFQLKYTQDLNDELGLFQTYTFNTARSEAYELALEKKLFPGNFECFWDGSAFTTTKTQQVGIEFFSSANCYDLDDWKLLALLCVGDKLISPDFGEAHTITRLK